MADVNGRVLQFADLQTLSGYDRAADVERWAREIGLAIKPTRKGVASSIDAWNAALGIAANRDTYAPDAVV